jgi:hypothetical protein
MYESLGRRLDDIGYTFADSDRDRGPIRTWVPSSRLRRTKGSTVENLGIVVQE